jgi:hypothetical protein
MSLIQIDPIGWLPDSFKEQIIDSVVSFVADQAEKVLGDEVSQTLRRLRSDAPFQQAVDRGLKEATDRFLGEYMVEDEDLVVAIARDPDFWKAESVRQALMEIVRHPDVYLAYNTITRLALESLGVPTAQFEINAHLRIVERHEDASQSSPCRGDPIRIENAVQAFVALAQGIAEMK